MDNPPSQHGSCGLPLSAPTGQTDSSLLQQVRSGDQNAARLIYERYAGRLLELVKARLSPSLARFAEPEEVVQSIFRSFFEKASQGFYDVPNDEELWKLLLVIGLNKVRNCKTFNFAAKRDVRMTSGQVSCEDVPSPDQVDAIAYLSLQMVVAETLDTLEPLARTIVELRIQGHEVAEIALKIGRSKRTVERSLQEFRHKLTRLLRDG